VDYLEIESNEKVSSPRLTEDLLKDDMDYVHMNNYNLDGETTTTSLSDLVNPPSSNENSPIQPRKRKGTVSKEEFF